MSTPSFTALQKETLTSIAKASHATAEDVRDSLPHH
jgi:hypothetical protein